MAKAKEIVGLDCGANVLDWTQKVLRLRFDEIVELRDAALNFDDIEGVHDMRVATRRLRSALRDFLPFMDKRLLKNVRRELKAVADALGAVRDQDVAIAALEKLETEIEGEQIKQGIESLLNERQAVRDDARQKLTDAITINNLAELQEDFDQAVTDAVRSQNKKHGNKQTSFKEAGKIVIGESLDEFLALGSSLYNPFETEPLHEMRIAAKRLRYAIELYVSCWGEKIAPFAEETARMQSFLGEVHDADVWIEDLGERLRKTNGENQNSQKAAVWLLSKFVKTRTANYRDALELWSKWKASDFARRMQAVIEFDI